MCPSSEQTDGLRLFEEMGSGTQRFNLTRLVPFTWEQRQIEFDKSSKSQAFLGF